MRPFLLCTFLLLPAIFLSYCIAEPRVKLGADVFIEKNLDMLNGKRVGLITNHTGRLSSGEFLLDVLLRKGVNVTSLFGPEHGIRGVSADGKAVNDTVDEKTGIPIFSLHGKFKKPTPEMLKRVDVLIYNIQDVGARFYTYISTMTLAMEAAAEKGIPFVVLDRPNPLGGELIDGPIIEDSLRSFLGMLPIPVVYGLTCGELASMVNNEGWLSGGAHVQLTVIPMEGWTRSMHWNDAGLEWIPPSPNIPTPQTAMIYPAMCIIEATNLSEGRGTERPFEMIGAPFVAGERLSTALNGMGIGCSPTKFTPTASKFMGQLCEGVVLTTSDIPDSALVLTGLRVVQKVNELWPEDMKVKPQNFARLLGKSDVLSRLLEGHSLLEMASEWRAVGENFRTLSSKYLLYH